jgi:flagellar basal-body rod protein FlgG
MMAQQLNMDVLANNLANVNTTGFKKARVEFQDLLYEQLRHAGTVDTLGQQLPLGLEVGHGARPAVTQKIFSSGDVQITNNPLDLMIAGNGFFQIAMPDGTVRYTRDGSLKMDSTGQLVTSDGHPLEPPVIIPAEATGIVVRSNGQIEITLPQGRGNEVVGQLQIAKVMNPAGMESTGKNLLMTTEACGEVVLGTPGLDGFGEITQGALENSNVKVVEEMVNLITTQHAYEVNTKTIQASNDMLNQANNLHR